MQQPGAGQELPDSGRYLGAAIKFADRVLADGRDTYGKERTPLFVDGLHARTLEPVRWKNSGETWILSNFASQQPLLRLLDGLTAVTGDAKYRRAAEETTRYVLEHLHTPNGLLYWGGHLAWDLDQEKPVGQGTDTHEMKDHEPYFELMWRVDRAATRRLLETIWAGHVLDWSLLDYNRHASVRTVVRPQWDHPFDEQVQVPFPSKGNNLSFCVVTPSLAKCGVTLAVLGNDQEALRWTRRLLYRWQQARDPKTGLSGGQLSYRKEDRAQQALGHVHPKINEAKIVATYHQTSRYHHLPLAQMQAAETLLKAGGRFAETGDEFLRWASDDLKVYARECYDPASGKFPARMTDGTPLDWRKAKKGYYIPESFAPQDPDGFLLWGYALAFRLTRDPAHWQMTRQLGKLLGLGDLGQPEGKGRALRLSTDRDDWRLIYVLLELHQATQAPELLRLACRIADNELNSQAPSGLFPRPGREYARTGDEIPLALLHLAAALQGKRSVLPAASFDSRFFHCEYHGPLEPYQQKRDDKRTYDDLVFYGPR
jgi:pectate lyase